MLSAGDWASASTRCCMAHVSNNLTLRSHIGFTLAWAPGRAESLSYQSSHEGLRAYNDHSMRHLRAPPGGSTGFRLLI